MRVAHATGEPAMEAVVKAELIALKARGIHRLEAGRGVLIECVAGALWITQQGDHRDITLLAGERFRLDRDGLAVVYGLEPARMRITATPGTAAAGQHLRAA